jgi:hypothetical protein
MFTGPPAGAISKPVAADGAIELERNEAHVQSGSSACSVTSVVGEMKSTETHADAHDADAHGQEPSVKHAAARDGEEPHIQHFSHLKQFTEHAKSKIDDHMDADHLDFKHHKPGKQEDKKKKKEQKKSEDEERGKKSPKNLIAKVMKVIKATAKPGDRDGKTETATSKFKRIARSSIAPRLSNTVVRAVKSNLL